MCKRILIGLVLCLLMIASAAAEIKIVKLKGGGKLKGEVTKKEDGSVEVKTVGGTVLIPADRILSIEDVVTPRDEYEKRLAKADPDKFEDQYDLAVWADKAKLYKEAKAALENALKLKPDSFKAKLLLRQVEAKLRVRPDSPREIPKPRTRPTETQPGNGTTVLKSEWLVSDKDISRIRLEELRKGDVVSIRLENKVVERFIKMMRGRYEFGRPGAADRFRGRSLVDKALRIIEEIDRDDVSFKDDILVRTDPKFMIVFRSRVWPIVSQYCAAAHCHGGDKAQGGLKLFTIAGSNVKVDYTNFLILSAYSRRGRRMIYRDDAEKSLLLQYGLPHDQAEYRHPKVEHIAFKDRKVKTYRSVKEWIENLKGPRTPNYRVKWKPPFGMKLDLSGQPSLPEPTTKPSKNDKDNDSPA